MTLRLELKDRPDFELAIDRCGQDVAVWDLLRSVADAEGRIRLGDRESCSIDEVVDVSIVEPKHREGPGWERGLQDEDAATALEEGYEPPAE